MKYAQSATTSARTVHSVAELQMALRDKARGRRIAKLRQAKHYTQQTMAERLHVSYRAYQTWEAGRMPEWDNVVKLARFHQVKPEAIVGDEEVAISDGLRQLDRIEAKLDQIVAAINNGEGP